jgi:hypothetical protein
VWRDNLPTSPMPGSSLLFRSCTALPSIPLSLATTIVCRGRVDVFWRALPESGSPLADLPFWNVGRTRRTSVPVAVVRSAAQEDGDPVQGL